MRAPLLLLFNMIGLFLQAQPRPEKITLSGELRNFLDLSRLPRYQSGSMELGESTYDRTGGNNDGFEGTYSFVRRNADSSLVMLDVDGPGEINRFATPTPTTDTLDFYIDDTVHPALSINYMDLFSGKVFPFSVPLCDTGVGGCFCYFPILFQRHCRIVSRGKRLQFHQIQYKLFPPGTEVEAFVPRFDTAERQTLKDIAGMVNRPISLEQEKSPGVSQSVTLQPGDARTIFSRGKGGRITGIFLEPRALSTIEAKDLFLRITWDGENTAAVDCPFSAFFGYGFYVPSMEGLLVGVYHGLHYCNIPMPFDRAATIELVNHSHTEAYRVRSEVFYTMQTRNAALEGRFYAHYQHNTLGKEQPFHVFLSVKGKGHYIGTILMAQGKEMGSTPFFEGDDSTAVDGVFRLHGTGSEDYFNGGWYDLPGRWDHPQSMLLSGCMGYTHVKSRTGGYRFMILDKIPFEQGFYHGIEHGRTSLTVVDAEYTSVGFYYADEGGRN